MAQTLRAPPILCELLALSTSEPSRLTFSLHTLAGHGSEDGSARDGWGVAFYMGVDVALFREPRAAGNSPLVRYLETEGPRTNLAVSHIRHATRGSVQFSNTQPFIRELGGRTHVFAHNGDMPDIAHSPAFATQPYEPVGQTDSELAFCALLARLQPLWADSRKHDARTPSLQQRLVLLDAFAAELRAFGPANFLYADGDALFAHAHRRRQQSGARAKPPGLWLLQRHCAPADPSPDRQAGVALSHEERAAVFIASVPLTQEAWRPLADGELTAVRNGQVLVSRLPAAT